MSALVRENREWPKKIPCQGKHREFGNFVKTQGKHREFCLNTGKTQGILLAQVVNVLILKVKDIVIVAAKKSIISSSWIGLQSHFCVCNTHKLCKLARGKFAAGQGKHREITGNLKIQFEWVPCLVANP